ncbi:MAG: ATP-binding domain-containing protein [Microbacteriaceae bacterium]
MPEADPARLDETELDRERAVVAALYRRLDALREDTETRLADVRLQNVGSNHQSRSERDAFVSAYEDRLRQLREVDARLVFGRLSLRDDGVPVHRYIGRIGMRDDEQRSVLVDWRAPQASAFYRATGAEPLGIDARRHLTMRDRTVLRLDDEVFDISTLAESDAEEIQGEGALLAALSAQRTGRMHDIVATIQAEQDRIIRSELRGALVVQGGPGTGKTAVALHRAAYLLYSHRERLDRSGVLIVGPSDAFLSYIEAVLPSLGETGVVFATTGDIFPGVTAADDDPAPVAAVKGGLEMAELLKRAVRSRQIVPDEAQNLDVNGDIVTLTPGIVSRAMAKARLSRARHNQARVVFVATALDQLAKKLGEQLRANGAAIDDDDLVALREDLRTAHDVRVALNTAWLPLTPEKLLRDLYARPAWLESLTPDWSPAKRAQLVRPRDAAFTVSDVALLDEAAELLGEPPRRADPGERERRRQRERDLDNARNAIRNMGVEGMVSAETVADGFADTAHFGTTAERAAADRSWTFGHVVVDEAQELSPMQWRMLVRRCPMRSFTIVGDVAQVASAAGATDWHSALQPFFSDRWRLEELTVNYRTPAQITRAAERLAIEHGLPITPSRAVREGQWPIETVSAAPDAMATGVADAIGRDRELDPAGTLAVITPAASASAVYADLAARYGADVGRGSAGLGLPIAVLTAREVKGLEFDCVVLVDPDAVVQESPRGAAALYVAMTRPTQRLTLVRPATPTA